MFTVLKYYVSCDWQNVVTSEGFPLYLVKSPRHGHGIPTEPMIMIVAACNCSNCKGMLRDHGLSQDFHNRVSKLGFQEFRVSKIPD